MVTTCAECTKHRYRYATAGADLSQAALKASRTWERDGQPTEKQKAELAMLRRAKAVAADNLADHEELCAVAVSS